MKLKIEYLNKGYSVTTEGTTIEEALSEIFKNPDYFISYNTDDSFMVLGRDILTGSIITEDIEATNNEVENSISESELFSTIRSQFSKVADVAFELIEKVRDDPDYNISSGAFALDVENLHSAGIITENSFLVLREGYWLFIAGTSDITSFTAKEAKYFTDNFPVVIEDLEKALAKYK